MIIEPRVRGFICTTAHPVGCEKAVQNQINYVKKQGQFTGPKNVLIIGASTGYGLATRIAAAFGARAKRAGMSLRSSGLTGLLGRAGRVGKSSTSTTKLTISRTTAKPWLRKKSTTTGQSPR